MQAALAVLVVDDNADLCSLIVDFLQSNSFEVMCAKDGTEALAMLASRQIHLALVDLLLPGPVSGEEVAARAVDLRAKVLTMSGALASDSRGRDLRHPHLAKPFRMATLLSSIDAVMRGARPIG